MYIYIYICIQYIYIYIYTYIYIYIYIYTHTGGSGGDCGGKKAPAHLDRNTRVCIDMEISLPLSLSSSISGYVDTQSLSYIILV